MTVSRQFAFLRSGSELGDSEHTFALRRSAVQPFFSRAAMFRLIISPIRGTQAEKQAGSITAVVSPGLRGNVGNSSFVCPSLSAASSAR